MIRVLLEGSGGPAGIGFTRCLHAADRKFWLIGTEVDPFNLMRSKTDEMYLVPPVKDKEYLNSIRSLIEHTKPDFLHAQPDVVIPVISEHRHKLGVTTFLPKHETIVTCQNKFLSYEKWRAAGINTPRTHMINNCRDLKRAFEEMHGEVWIREIKGAFGKGSLATSSIKLAKEWIDYRKGWGNYTAAELLSPNSTTWSSIWYEGELVVAQGRKRLYWEFSNRAPSGVTGLTGAGITVSDKEVDKVSQEAIFAIDKNPHGIFSVDLTYDFKGNLNPTEINIGRFFTTIEFLTRAGLNMPYIYVCKGLGLKPPKIKRKHNPIQNKYCWIRGIDIEPILTTTSKLSQIKKFR